MSGLKIKLKMPATVVISLDLELSWGMFDVAYGEELLKMARWTHDTGVPNLLGHFSRTGVSASWAIVGAMMRKSLPDVSGLPEIRYPHFPKDWFTYVPKDGDESDHPEWFGASLVDLIRKTRPQQEIGFHSFSHVILGAPEMTRERAVAEYQECARIAHELGIPTTCFIHPRNAVGFLPELREAGFTCYREFPDLPPTNLEGKWMSIRAVSADFLGLTPPVFTPFMKDGLVCIPGSLRVRYAAGWRKHIPDASRSRRLRKGLERVRKHGGIFHVWFHPENLYAEWPRVENVVAHFLDDLSAMVRNGEVRCMTMGQITDEFLSANGHAASMAGASNVKA